MYDSVLIMVSSVRFPRLWDIRNSFPTARSGIPIGRQRCRTASEETLSKICIRFGELGLIFRQSACCIPFSPDLYPSDIMQDS